MRVVTYNVFLVDPPLSDHYALCAEFNRGQSTP